MRFSAIFRDLLQNHSVLPDLLFTQMPRWASDNESHADSVHRTRTLTTSSNEADFETGDQQLPEMVVENGNSKMVDHDIYENPDNEYIGMNDWPREEGDGDGGSAGENKENVENARNIKKSGIGNSGDAENSEMMDTTETMLHADVPTTSSKPKKSEKQEKSEKSENSKNSEKLLNKTRIFYGSSPMYLLLRYHNFLCQRLLYIYRYSEKQIFKQQDSAVKRAKAAMSAEYNPITSRLQGSEPVADVLCLRRKLDIDVRDYYVAFIDQVKKLLDSNIDQDQYEDNLQKFIIFFIIIVSYKTTPFFSNFCFSRDMFSTRAYHMFTINKIIVHAVKHLQQVCQDSQKLLECHKTFRRELSGEMRSTPNVTNEVLNNAELMDSTKEQGVT